MSAALEQARLMRECRKDFMSAAREFRAQRRPSSWVVPQLHMARRANRMMIECLRGPGGVLMTLPHPRFYSGAESIERVATLLVRRHGSPMAALEAIRPALVRMYERSVAVAMTPEDWQRSHIAGVRYGWRIEVRIELLKLARHEIPQPRPQCPGCRGAGRYRDAHQRWKCCHVCAGGGDPAVPLPGVQVPVVVPDGYMGRLRHIYCPDCRGRGCKHCEGIGCLAVPAGGAPCT